MLARQACKFIRPMFHTFRSFSSISHKRLAKALEKELEHEHQRYKMDDDISSFMTNSGFKTVDGENHTLITLKKKTDDAEVEITFHARAPPIDEGNEPKEPQGNEEQDEPPGSYIDFQVLIKKSNTNTGLIFECLSMDQEINIANIVFSDDLINTPRRSSFGRRGSEYRGPDFPNLDEKVKNLLIDYLKSFGVDDDLAFFIDVYSLDKEYRLYMEWLRHVKNFVS